MENYAAIAQKFVEGNVQNRLIIIATTLRDFFNKEAPIIESVQKRLTSFGKKSIFSVSRDEIEEYVRTDVEGAQKSLRNYNRSFGRIDHHLSMMTSNYRLPHFLKENGIPPTKIREVMPEINAYWDKTYRPLVQKFSEIRDDMQRIRDILEREVKILESVPGANYFKAFSHQKEIHFLFNQERKLFWEIVKKTSLSKQELNSLFGILLAHQKKTKAKILGFLQIKKEKVQKDLEQHQTAAERAVLVLAYIIGAANVYLNIRNILFQKVGSGIVGGISSLVEKRRISKQVKKVKAIKGAIVHSLDDVSGSALSELAELI